MCLELEKQTCWLSAHMSLHMDTLKHIRMHVHTHTHVYAHAHACTRRCTCKLLIVLARQALAFFAFSFSSQVLDSWKGAVARGWGDGEGTGEGQAMWREANLFLQSTDGVRTNYTVGIKTPFKIQQYLQTDLSPPEAIRESVQSET